MSRHFIFSSKSLTNMRFTIYLMEGIKPQQQRGEMRTKTQLRAGRMLPGVAHGSLCWPFQPWLLSGRSAAPKP